MGQIDLSDVQAAAVRLTGVIRETQMVHAGWLERLTQQKVMLKPENLQRAGSFKIRGAYNLISQLTDAEKKSGVVAASAGNHAQGVALAATLLGIKSRVYMPEGASIAKVEATKNYGAEVKFAGSTLDEAISAALADCEATKAIFIPPFDNQQIVAGQGTVGLEIIEQMPDVKTVLVCTGGGGLLAGVALAIKTINPDVKVIGVQAEQAAAYPESLKQGRPIGLASMKTMADGIAVGKPGEIPFALIQEHVDEVITVSENDLSIALLQTLERGKLLVEPAGAAACAAVIKNPNSFEGPIAIVLSGGNIDPLLLDRIMRNGLAVAGRYLTVEITISDNPGSLANLLTEIGKTGASVVDVFHLRTDPSLSSDQVRVNLTLETRGENHRQSVLSSIAELGMDYKLK
jgi:threonine dehydratase